MSVALIRSAKAGGARVTCEVTPHHLLLGDDRITGFRADAKVNPPLREEHDAAGLREAVRDGTIDAFATDHAPHAREEKERLLSEAPVGFTGLEIAVGAYALALPDLPVDRFVALLSTNPARILGVEGGTLRAGSAADITVSPTAIGRSTLAILLARQEHAVRRLGVPPPRDRDRRRRTDRDARRCRRLVEAYCRASTIFIVASWSAISSPLVSTTTL